MTIVELIGQLKRTFATIRLYSLSHENTRIAEAQLHQALTAYLDTHGALCLVVRATQLEVDDKKVYEDERKEESLVRALFVDGVESLTFLAGIGKDELAYVVRAWHGALTHSLGAEHSFATLMWEHELRSVSAAIRPGIAELGADQEAEANKAAEGRLRQVYAALTSPHAPGTQVVDGASLGLVRAVLGDVSADALARRDDEEDAAGLALTKADRAALASGMASSTRGSGQRTLFALSRLWHAAPAEQRDALTALVARVVTELVTGGRVAELARALTRIDATALLECLGAPEVVAQLVRDGSADAFTVLGMLPVSCVDALAEPYAQASPELRARLTTLIADKSPPGETLATWLLAHGAAVVAPLFELAERLEPSARELLVRTALVHDEPEVVLRGLARVPAGALGDYRSLVAPRLSHAHAEVRRAALGVYVRSQDDTVPALIEAQLSDPRASEEWQRSCVLLLGTHGGPSAARLLIELLGSARPRGLRVAAAQALANTDTPEARQALEHEAKKLLGDRAVKRAAKDVLARWGRRRSTAAPEAGGPS